MNDKTTREKIHDLIDAIVIDGNEFDMVFMNSIHNELRNPLEGEVMDALFGRVLIKTYVDNLLDQALTKIAFHEGLPKEVLVKDLETK